LPVDPDERGTVDGGEHGDLPRGRMSSRGKLSR